LEKVLQELVKLLSKEEEMKKNVKSATLYPKIVVVVLIVAVFVLMTLVVPKFSTFYAKYSAELPIPTLILIGVSKFFKNAWYLIIIFIGFAYFMFARYSHSRTGRFKIDRLKFKLPVFGDLNAKISNARFGHILSALYKSGLPMPRCLEVAARVIGNEAFSREVFIIRDDIQKGATLADAMSRQTLFPPVVIETTAVGERAGSLDEMLDTVAEHYDLEVGHTVKNLATLLEPLLLIMIFGMVTLLALAIFLPIWNLSQVVNK
jgi:type II secretory pathway component PulF